LEGEKHGGVQFSEKGKVELTKGGLGGKRLRRKQNSPREIPKKKGGRTDPCAQAGRKGF